MFNKIKISLMIFLFLFLGSFSSVDAAYFRFDPSSINTSSGNNFEIKVILEPGSDQIYSTDIYINYDNSLLKVINVKAENLFPTVSNDTSTANKIYIAAMVNDPTSFISSSGAVATITFQALKNASGNLSIDCNNSKIIKNDANATNVLNCSQNSTTSITIGGSSTSTSTTTSTSSTDQSTANNIDTTSLPESLPQTGFFDNVINIGLPGITIFLLGLILKISI